jgi:hypothetical protein
MPVSASAAFYVLRRWDVWLPAAALGGLIYGFSPYMVAEGLEHPVLVFAPWLPLIALVLSRIVASCQSAFTLGLKLGLLLIAQFFCEPEILTMVVIVAGVALILTVLLDPVRARKKMLKRLVGSVGVTAGLAALFLAYPIWMIFAGPQHYTGPPWGLSNPYFNNLSAFIAPGPLERVSFGLRGLGRHIWFGLAWDADGYIGVPVLFILCALGWWSRRRFRTQVALLCLLTSFVLSLGPHLWVGGHRTSVPLPFLLLSHISLVNDILPARFSLLTAASGAAVIAFGLDDWRRVPRTAVAGFELSRRAQRRALARMRTRAGLMASVVFLAVVVSQMPRWPYSTQNVSPLPTGIRQAIPSGDPVALTYPYAEQLTPAAMGWQLTDGFDFRILGGYGEHPEIIDTFYVLPARMHPALLQRFLANQEGLQVYGPEPVLDQTLVASTRATLKDYSVRLVIIDGSAPGSSPVMKLFLAALGPPLDRSKGFAVWASAKGPL